MMNNRTAFLAAGAASIIGINVIRQFIKPKVIGLAEHDGIAVQCPEKRNCLVADRVSLLVHDDDDDEYCYRHVEWSFRPVTFKADVYHILA